MAEHPLQTWEWGKFRKEWGNEILFTKHGLLTLHKIPFTKYKIGTLIRGSRPTSSQLKSLRELGKKENLAFIKLEPAFVGNNETHTKIKKLLRRNGAIPGKTLFTPTSFSIDLTKNEEELMKSFSSKTRYNIRLATRKGVRVVENNSDKAFAKYISLTRETVKRQNFYAHTERYHRLMWEHLHKKPISNNQQPIAKLLTAVYNKEIITTWILFVWKDTLYYPYGASTDKHKSVMANNLMMWEAIRLGKEMKLTTFDLWGREPGKGFTKFKEGYGPDILEFLGTWDLVIKRPAYYLYRTLDLLRWKFLRIKTKFTKPTF